MSNKAISLAIIALLGFAAMPAEAHIVSNCVTPVEIEKSHTGYIAQNLEKILPDITNVEPQDLLDTSYIVVAPNDDSDGVSL